MKKEKINPYLSKKELAELRKAKEILDDFQKELEDKKSKAEEDLNKKRLPIIFKDNNNE